MAGGKGHSECKRNELFGNVCSAYWVVSLLCPRRCDRWGFFVAVRRYLMALVSCMSKLMIILKLSKYFVVPDRLRETGRHGKVDRRNHK